MGFKNSPTHSDSWNRSAGAFPHVVGPGMGGPVVQSIQNQLHITPTGMYDAATQAEVEAFQAHHGLEPTGVVDAVTWGRMMA